MDILFSPRYKYRWRALLALLLLVISWLAFSPKPPVGIDTGWDKLNHLLAFATLAVVSALSLAGARRERKVVLGLLAYGIFIELVQTQVPGRSAEVADVLADMVGVALGLLLLAGLERLLLIKR
ncbi:VanZ family protein [Paucibacter soli]|uniref:VanZ family protein n=1 Tax=Paucibacter soli TaxID=3133433 RepID=UPI0030A1DA22